MTINYRQDSDRMTHQVWAQRQAASCAIACIWMARNQAKQMTFNEGEWSIATRLYRNVVDQMDLSPPPSSPMCLAPSAHQNNQSSFGNMFSQFGTYMGQVGQQLKNDGLRVTRLTQFARGTAVDPRRLSDTTPAIVLLGWYQGNTRNGGHFIVASKRASSGQIVYLDPWGGRLIEMGAGPQYDGTGRFEQVMYIAA